MFHCILCQFDVVLDDTRIVSMDTGRCICLRCYCRESDSMITMSKHLRHELTAVANGVE